ncbi:MAG: type II secretion system F family protein [Deltaproteobacteria bacterium]|nr:type II secretion system F family protein [Deltaproteobacteria bacterium]
MNPVFVVLPLLVGIALVGLGYAVWRFANPYRTPTDRVAEFTGKVARPTAIQPSSIVYQSTVPGALRRVASLARPSRPEELSLQRKAMLQAGYTSPNALEVYHLVRGALALGLPLFVAIPFLTASLTTLALVVVVSAGIGYFLPVMVVSQRAGSRKQAIARGLPDALDLIVACTEAGLGLDASFDRVAEGIGGAAPVLALELQIVGGEVAAGVPRIQALRRLDDRTGVPEVTSLVNVLVQADRLGTPVAQALRIYAQTSRTRRMLRAEEKAAAISPKLTVAMILFLLPSLFVVILGPAVVRMIQEVMPVLGGQR